MSERRREDHDRQLTPGKQSGTSRQGVQFAVAPGKRTLTQDLKPAPQAEPSPGVHQAAAHGVSGSGGALPFVDQIQRSFGRHDIGNVRAHSDGAASAGATAMGADAFAMGDRVAFGRQPDLHLAAHEAAHVVQQRGGVQLADGVGQEGDGYEQNADAVADLVVQGKSAEALLDRFAGSGGGGSSNAAVQRHAFVGGKQITSADPDAVGAVLPMVKDDVVRDYTSTTEMKRHAAKTTDYLGNLTDGTWVRFSPSGINLLGEDHTLVRLEQVAPAVNSKSFIYEPIAVDDMSANPEMKAAYEHENAARFKTFGVEKEKDKKQFGAESIYPKLGFNMNMCVPYFGDAKGVKKLTKASGYTGQPVQRYLKIGWGYAKDVKADVAAKKVAKTAVKPKQETLAKVMTAVEPALDGFITALVVDGWLGDELIKPANLALLPKLLKFTLAFVDAMVELAIDDPSSRMSAKDKKKFAGATKQSEKDDMFSDWRNFKFEDSVKDAAKRGVRYAGMGFLHLEHLRKVGLPANSHDYDMSDVDLTAFQDATAKLKAKAVKQP